MMNPNRTRGARSFLARLIVALATDQDKDEFVSQELRRLRCDFCAEGFPTNGDGNHDVLGVVIPCNAATQGDHL